MSGSVFELRDVTVSYDGRTVLDIPHLEVRPGETLTLLGENGSGKTTLLRLLGLLVRPDAGCVFFRGEKVDYGSSAGLLALRRRMAAVMQQPLLCKMNVRRNVALGLRFRRLPNQEIDRRVDSWLGRLSITHLGDRPASKLSGGEAQRTSLARAMAIDPEVLFLDEPFSALDAPTRHGLLQEFQSVLEDCGVTAVFATHDRGEALGLGDRVAVLIDGRIAQIGSADDVFYRPDQLEVARFVGFETLIPGRVSGAERERSLIDCGDCRVEAEGSFEPGSEVWVAVRPEEIDLQGLSFAGTAGRNILVGTITRISPAETHYLVELDCGVKAVAAIGRARFRELGLKTGKKVRASFTPHAAHLIPRDPREN